MINSLVKLVGQLVGRLNTESLYYSPLPTLLNGEKTLRRGLAFKFC
jgi:hypothetical protein